jgi:hypothetical protein
MRKIVLDWQRLLGYSSLFLVCLLFLSLFILLWFSGGLEDAWITLSISQFKSAVFLGLSLFILVSLPVLLLRFLFYFFYLLYRGRNAGISVLSYQTLFNPLNFLLFPSLLNPQGLACRRRCLWSLTLLILQYGLIFLII